MDQCGKCCYCAQECNILSQACGSCARRMTLYGYVNIWNKEEEVEGVEEESEVEVESEEESD